MTVVQVSVEVNASPERVWSVVADPRNLARWDRHVAGVRDVPENGLGEGTEYTTEVRLMCVRAHSTSRVVEIRQPAYSKFRLGGLVEGIVETWLAPLDQGERARLS